MGGPRAIPAGSRRCGRCLVASSTTCTWLAVQVPNVVSRPPRPLDPPHLLPPRPLPPQLVLHCGDHCHRLPHACAPPWRGHGGHPGRQLHVPQHIETREGRRGQRAIPPHTSTLAWPGRERRLWHNRTSKQHGRWVYSTALPRSLIHPVSQVPPRPGPPARLQLTHRSKLFEATKQACQTPKQHTACSISQSVHAAHSTPALHSTAGSGPTHL